MQTLSTGLVQQALKIGFGDRLNPDPGPVDGVFGSRTATALNAYLRVYSPPSPDYSVTGDRRYVSVSDRHATQIRRDAASYRPPSAVSSGTSNTSSLGLPVEPPRLFEDLFGAVSAATTQGEDPSAPFEPTTAAVPSSLVLPVGYAARRPVWPIVLGVGAGVLVVGLIGYFVVRESR